MKTIEISNETILLTLNTNELEVLRASLHFALHEEDWTKKAEKIAKDMNYEFQKMPINSQAVKVWV